MSKLLEMEILLSDDFHQVLDLLFQFGDLGVVGIYGRPGMFQDPFGLGRLGFMD